MSKTAIGLVNNMAQSQANLNRWSAALAADILKKSFFQKALMTTKARIGVYNSDGSIRSIYVGNDGYLSWTGTRLLKHFNTPSKVRKLISMGGLIVLGDEFGEKHDPDIRTGKDPVWCQFYGRDRGDKDMGAVTNPTAGAFVCMEYSYLWKDRQWWLVEDKFTHFNFTDLRVALTTDRITA